MFYAYVFAVKEDVSDSKLPLFEEISLTSLLFETLRYIYPPYWNTRPETPMKTRKFWNELKT